MTAIDRKTALFENIVRLRRTERELPLNRDVAAVRAALEHDLGDSISLRLAGRLLGVSHTALARWVRTGDLPTVFTATGRNEIPLPAVLTMFDAVNAEREAGHRSRHVLEPMMIEARDRAARMNVDEFVRHGPAGPHGHRRAELRSLAYHRALARRLRRPMIDDAMRVVWRWRDQRKIDPRYAREWEEILARPIAEVQSIIGEDSRRSRDLRQNSPFAGMLTEPERRKINQAIDG